MSRTVFHLEVPDFFVAVEKIRHRSLATRPVLIASAAHSRAQIIASSTEARNDGVVAGMRLAAAQRLCPRATVLPPDRILYGRAAGAIEKLLGDFTPVFENSQKGRFFLDMSGTERLFGSGRDSASKIRRELAQRLRLPSSIGSATNKSVSKVASSVISGDLLDVFPGCERTFLSPWEVRRLPGTGAVSDPGLFDDLNIRQIGQLATYSVGQLSSVFGRMGPVLNQRAHGVDPRPVIPPAKKPIIREEEPLPSDTNSRDLLLAYLFGLVERCGYRLRRQGVAARTAKLMIGYSDDLSMDGRMRISPPTFDDGALYSSIQKLFARVAVRRVRVRYLSLTLSDLAVLPSQPTLFKDRGRDLREKSLTTAMDTIRDRFGIDAIARGMAA